MQNNRLSVLAISGSLRASSANNAILQYIRLMLPPEIDYEIYAELATIPPFDDAAFVPAAVIAWRNKIELADAVLFCSPEYAFGVPGSLKNALDWTVGSTAFTEKRVALITAATGGEKAHMSLVLTLSALGTNIAGDLLISFVRSKMDAQGAISDAPTRAAVQLLVDKLITSLKPEDNL
jgi:chromate reductase